MIIHTYKEVDSRIVEVLKYDAGIYAILLSKTKELYIKAKRTRLGKDKVIQLLAHARRFGFFDSTVPRHLDVRPFKWLEQYAKDHRYI